MMSIRWKNYLTFSGQPLRKSTNQEVDDLESHLGKKLPTDFRELVIEHQGQVAENLAIQLPNGSKPGFSCILYGLTDDNQVPEELESYGIDWMTEVVQEELGHTDIVVFSRKGNSIYALDYREDSESPSVVLIDGDFAVDQERSKTHLARSITEFLTKYEVK